MAQVKETKPDAHRYQYAVKIICTANIPGTSQTTGSLLPGVYQTVVNIHNPHYETVRYRMKIAVAGTSQISKFVKEELGPDHAIRVNCDRITTDFGITFIHGVEGFLVIESDDSLDVVAVYTAGQVGGQVESLDVEHVRERKIE